MMSAVTVDVIRKIGQIKDSLLGCSDEKSIDAVFNQFGIKDFPVKTMLLRLSMEIQEVFDAPIDQSPTDEAEYREELQFFFDGKWKEFV